jgi:hypothetical protein
MDSLNMTTGELYAIRKRMRDASMANHERYLEPGPGRLIIIQYAVPS